MASPPFYITMSASLSSAAPYIPMSLHLIISALIPIYTGAHASLSRPSSAASPPPRKRKRSASSTSSSSSSDDEDESTVKMEGLSPSDAVVFPLIAGATLVGFYVLIKYFGPQLLNKVLGIYFSFMACFSVGKMVADLVRVGEGFVWPAYYVDQGRVWRVRQAEKRVEAVGGEEGERKSPLPGRWGRMELGDALVGWAWFARGLLSKEYEVKLRFRGTTALKAKLSLRAVTAGFFGVAVVLYANLVDTPWYLTNLQGFAFSYAALQLLSPTTFATGSLILVALFFYDIYFVFYTPIMVSVATNLDIPIKMLFPRPETEDKKPSLAMLGLGDVVLPGIMIGLALRFDLYLHYLRRQTKKDKSSGQTESIGEDISSSEKRLTDQEILKLPYVPATTRWGERFWTLGWSDKQPLRLSHSKQERDRTKANNTGTGSGSKTITSIVPRFKKTYFYASIVGYVIGMTTTLVVMHVFKHAQPALLYLVPGVLGSVWLTALVRGEVKDMWAYTEMVEEEDEKEDGKTKRQDDKDEAGKSWYQDIFGNSFFGREKAERNEEKLRKALEGKVQVGEEDGAKEEKGEKTEEKEGKETTKVKGKLFDVSIKPVVPRRKRVQASDTTALSLTEGRPVSRSASGSGFDDAVLVSRDEALESRASGSQGATGVETRRVTRSRRA